MTNLANWQTCHIILFPLLTTSSFLLFLKNLLHFPSSVTSKILYVETFGWNVTVMISNFVLNFSQSNRKKVCWPEIVLYGTFLPQCCRTLQLNQHMFFWHRKESAFMRDTLFRRKSKQIPKHNHIWTSPPPYFLFCFTAQCFWDSKILNEAVRLPLSLC